MPLQINFYILILLRYTYLFSSKNPLQAIDKIYYLISEIISINMKNKIYFGKLFHIFKLSFKKKTWTRRS